MLSENCCASNTRSAPARLTEYTRNLSDADRERARETLDSQRSALGANLDTTLYQAYGLRKAEDGRVEQWSDHLISRMPTDPPRLEVGRPFDAALRALGREPVRRHPPPASEAARRPRG